MNISFADWYESLPLLDRPQYKDHGGKRILFVDYRVLPTFGDYVVVHVEEYLVHLV